MAGTKRKPRMQDDAHRLLIQLGVMNRDGYMRAEPRILYTKNLMVIELQSLGWSWVPGQGWKEPCN